MSTFSSLSVRPEALFCTGSTRSVQTRRVGARPGPAVMTRRCRELSRLVHRHIQMRSPETVSVHEILSLVHQPIQPDAAFSLDHPIGPMH